MTYIKAVVLAACLSACSGIRRKAAGSEGDRFSPYDGHALLKVSACNEDAILSLHEMIEAASCTRLDDSGSASMQVRCSFSKVICPIAAAERLLDMPSLSAEVVSEDAGAHFRASSPDVEKYVETRGVSAASFYSSYRNLADQEKRVRDAVQASNGRATLETAGKSLQGRAIKLVRIRGKGYSPGKPRVVLTFQVHAREWVAGMSGVYAVEELTVLARDNPSYFDGMEVVIVPMGNPDGFIHSMNSDRMWRKNMADTGSWFCSGVDLNRNFPLGWGGPHATSTSKCSDVYIGSKALSEPESQVIAKVIDESPVTVFIDTHTYGRMILKPWSYTWTAHPRLSEVDDLGESMIRAVKAADNGPYFYGGNDLLGPASGALQDHTNGGLGYTYELGMAFDPPANTILPSAQGCLAGIKVAIEWSKAR